MNKRAVLILSDSIYLTAMTLCATLYTFGNYDKTFANLMGLLQLGFSMVTIVVFVLRIKTNTSGLPRYVFALYSIAQILPIVMWIQLSFAVFTIFPGVEYTVAVGLPLHIGLFLWGIAAFIMRSTLRKRISEYYKHSPTRH